MQKLAELGDREDGRGLDEFRPVSIDVNPVESAEGSARVKLGKTDLLVGIKMSVDRPYPDKPDQGILMTGAELKPMAFRSFEGGAPKPEAVEIARVVDRGIRESQMIDMKALCIEPGEKAWVVNIDIQVIDFDGNIIDAATIGAVTALKNTIVPIARLDVGEDFPLPVNDMPIAVTHVKIGDAVLIDPTALEEQVADARLTVTTDSAGDIRAMQKGLNGAFSYERITSVIDSSIQSGKEIRDMME